MGDGEIPIFVKPDTIELPVEKVFEIDDENQNTIEKSLNEFIDVIFPDLTVMQQTFLFMFN